MTIELPDVRIGSHSLTSEEARIELACALYGQWKVSISQAVKIAGISRVELWKELGRRKIPIQYGMEDLEHDLRVMDELAAKKTAT